MDEKDLEELRDLVELLKSNGVAHFQMERADWRVKLSFTGPNEKTGSPAQGVDLAQLAQMVNGGAAAPTAPQTAPAPVAALAVAAEAQNDTAEAEANVHVVKSPLVGTFYPSPSPGADPFVKVGDRVAMGQVLCIVEAMKLMNEVEADASGEVVKVLVEPGQPVEYGQGLFAVRS